MVGGAPAIPNEDVMKVTYPLVRAVAWLACSAAPALSVAQTQAPNPADPQATVPATRYRSALPYHPGSPSPATAERNWKELNRIVGAYDSMALTMGQAQPNNT